MTRAIKLKLMSHCLILPLNKLKYSKLDFVGFLTSCELYFAGSHRPDV